MLTGIALVAVVTLGVWLVARQVTPSAKQAIAVDGVPEALLSANGLLYEGSSTGSLIALDPVNDAVLHRVQFQAPIEALASRGSTIFAITGDFLVRLTPDLAVERRRSVAPLRPSLLAGEGSGLWMAGSSEHRVLRFSPTTLSVIQSVPIWRLSQRDGDLSFRGVGDGEASLTAGVDRPKTARTVCSAETYTDTERTDRAGNR